MDATRAAATPGRSVTVLEPTDKPGRELSIALRWRITDDGRGCLQRKATVREISPGDVVWTGADGNEQRTGADPVIIASETTADSSAADLLEHCGVPLHVAGNCRSVGRIEGAIHDGYSRCVRGLDNEEFAARPRSAPTPDRGPGPESPMRGETMIRVVFDQRSDVGKSTITVNLATIAAARGMRVAVVDLESQANASQDLLGTGVADAKPIAAGLFAQMLGLKLSGGPICASR